MKRYLKVNTKQVMKSAVLPLSLLLPAVALAQGVASNPIDPFTGQSQSYEKIIERAKAAQAEQKLVQAQYEIAHYREQIAGVHGISKPSGGKLKALEASVAALQQQVTALQATLGKNGKSVAQPQTAQAQAPQAATAPKLVGITRTATGRIAWVKTSQGVIQVAPGSQFGSWKVKAVSADGVTLVRQGHQRLLPVSADWAGQLGISGKVKTENTSGFGSVPPAPGSTPASATAMTQQGAATITQALQGGA
ncbi:hypothetical protein [Acidihalobacter yilgarnensis]|nr:hypothetical protein [Acidihalobacter yilgarnensis]